MTEVALASGFGSVRRFNETFQQLYDRPPAQLRRLGGPDETASHGEAVRLSLALQGRPTTGTPCWASWRLRAIPGVERVAGGRYERTPGDRRRRRRDPRRAGGAKSRLNVAVRFPKISALPAIIARVRRVFDLAADPAAIGEHLRQGPGAGAAGRRAAGPARARRLGRLRAGDPRHPRPADHRRRRPRPRRQAGRARMAQPLPEALASEGLTHVFPTPQQLADADFAALGMPRVAGRGARRHDRGGRRRSAALRPEPRPRRGDRRAEGPAGHRRMDGAVHRHARAARAGRLSRRRHRPDARAGRRQTAAAPARPNSSPAPRPGGPGAPMPPCTSGHPKGRLQQTKRRT